MLRIEAGSNLLLSVVSPNGTAGLFPQASIYDSSGALFGATPVNITGDLGNGLYQQNLTGASVPGVGKYSGFFRFFDDAAHTLPTAAEDLQPLELEVFETAPIAHVNFAYDEGLETLFASVWLERNGRVVLAPTSCAVAVRDKDEAAIANMASAVFDAANGVFNLSQAGVLLSDNRSYNVLVSVTDPIGTVQTVHALSTVA